MKKTLITILFFCVLAVSQAGATVLIDDQNGAEKDLFQIYNELFYGTDNFTSSQDLFNSRGVAEGADYVWTANDGKVHLTYKDASFVHHFGFQIGATKTPIADVTLNDYQPASASVNSSVPFMWYTETDDPGSGATGVNTWYSASPLNVPGLNGFIDRFVALKVTDAERDYYNTHKALETGYSTLRDNIYLFAFEDWPVGLGGWGDDGLDKDYNDIVYLLDQINPEVPEPATMMFFGMSILGLLGFRRKRQ